ncbi:MAG: nicotinate-nucleotide adenylyltransferase [Johnsonella sp.]|nr:nicotinate-nucleotide adenylyltransferase [Johnsonella sp.]
MKEIGILGGTFDPIHNGHIKLAQNAKNQFSLDEIWFIPAPSPPHKNGSDITKIEHRLKMVHLAIDRIFGFFCSETELKREGASYTYETLQNLSADYPEYRFSFIMGADSLYEIESWKNPQLIMKLCRLLVAARDYEIADKNLQKEADRLRREYGAKIGFISDETVDISSSRLREMIRHKKNIIKYVPREVGEYILAHGLYMQGEDELGQR